MTPKTLSFATITAFVLVLSAPAFASMNQNPDDTSSHSSYTSVAVDPRTLSPEDLQGLYASERKMETKSDNDDTKMRRQYANWQDNSHLERKHPSPETYPHSVGRYIPFKIVGEFQGLLRDFYQTAFPLEDALTILMDGIIGNARFYLSVGTIQEGLEVDSLPNTGGLKNFFNFRKLDMPVDYVAFLLQRLFPSQDGLNIIPNQLSTIDPVRGFTPKTIGAILNEIRDFYRTPPTNREQFKRNLSFTIDHNLNPHLRQPCERKTAKKIEDAYVKRENQKKHKLIADFTETLLLALEDVTNTSIYPPYFVHKVLFSFALQKAAREGEPKAAMIDFYRAMPQVVQENFLLNEPFSKEMYTALRQRLVTLYSIKTPYEEQQKARQNYGQNYRLIPREEICFLYGKDCFDRVFPKTHYTSTAHYQGVSFSNCGEVTLLNWLNLFLFDFSQNKIRASLLEEMEDVYKPLQDYYKEFFTVEAQQSSIGKKKWISVVSGHNLANDPDIFYKKGGGTCEITKGFTSMAGIIRALFPDAEHRRIREAHTLSPLERGKLTLQHLVDKFSINNEIWTWSVDEAEPAQEQAITKNDININMAKSGQNIPMHENEPLQGTILSLSFQHGHYTACFSDSDGDEGQFIQSYERSVLQSLTPDRRLTEIESSLSASALRAFFMNSMLTPNDMSPEDMSLGKSFEKLSLVQQERVRLMSILRLDLQNTTLRAILFSYLLNLKQDHFYLMAANLLHSLPLEDPMTVSGFLLNYIDENGELIEPISVHPRIDNLRTYTLNKFKDRDFAYDCLLINSGISNINQYLMKHIPPQSLSKEKVLPIIVEWSDTDGINGACWETFMENYGNVFIDSQTNEINANEFLLHRPEVQGETVLNKILMDSSLEVVQFFVDKHWLTKELLLSVWQEGSVYQTELIEKKENTHIVVEHKIRRTLLSQIRDYQMTPHLQILLKLSETFSITKEDLIALHPSIFDNMLSDPIEHSNSLYPDGRDEISRVLGVNYGDFGG